MINEKPQSIWSQVDWLTIGLYIALMLFGWLSICGASYTFGDNDLLSLGTRSGMQIVWIGTSICLGFVILMMDSRFFDTFSFVIYGVLLLLLFATIFNPHDIKGSHSWLVIGPLRLQPAEFGKFATALALAKLMSTYGYNIQRWKDFAAACAVVFVPMLCIVGQRETGSALVYLTFFLMFYREGMPGSILFTGVAWWFTSLWASSTRALCFSTRLRRWASSSCCYLCRYSLRAWCTTMCITASIPILFLAIA